MKYLGVDFGLRRLGLAISEGNLASPFTTIDVRGLHDAISKVAKISREQRIEKIVVGLPEGKIGKTVLRFINALKKHGLGVQGVDETLSSQHATDEMIKLNIPQKKRRVKDAYSAAIILQEYLENTK